MRGNRKWVSAVSSEVSTRCSERKSKGWRQRCFADLLRRARPIEKLDNVSPGKWRACCRTRTAGQSHWLLFWGLLSDWCVVIAITGYGSNWLMALPSRPISTDEPGNEEQWGGGRRYGGNLTLSERADHPPPSWCRHLKCKWSHAALPRGEWSVWMVMSQKKIPRVSMMTPLVDQTFLAPGNALNFKHPHRKKEAAGRWKLLFLCCI